MHTMKPHDESGWEVGFFEPTDDGGESWHLIRHFPMMYNAARYVNYLNGGHGEPFTEDFAEEDNG
jgi:hypothetical protein